MQVPANTAEKLVVDVRPERSSGLVSDDFDFPGHVPWMVVGLSLNNCKAIVMCVDFPRYNHDIVLEGQRRTIERFG